MNCSARRSARHDLGLTAVGDTAADADRRYRDACGIVLAEAEQALQEQPLPS
jgi:hypothetical protein